MPALPKIAVCGCGYWGKNHVRIIAQAHALAAVVDTDIQLAQKTAASYGVPALSFEDVLADARITGVVIATPAVAHADMARRALQAGKHVLVEKPLALDSTDADALRTLAKQSGKTLMVGHLMHYHPAYIAVQQMVAQGRIGNVKHIYSTRMNFGRVRSDESVLWSFAPHDISMILGLTGSLPQAVTAQAIRMLGRDIDDAVNIQMMFDGAVTAHICVSWLHPVKDRRFMVTGDKGMLVFDDSQPWESKLLLYLHHVDTSGVSPVAVAGQEHAIALTPADTLAAQCEHFLKAISEQLPVKAGADEAADVIHVLSQVEKALERGRNMASTPKDLPYFVHETAVIDSGVAIGEQTRIWHFSHVLSGSRIGSGVTVGQNVMIGPNVTVGDRCKIQNNVSLYSGVTLEEDVFCGPSCVFTNVNTPRAAIERKDAFLPTPVGKGATIGANATIVCGHRIGAYSMIGAGAVVTHDVRPHALLVGNPARQVGWVSHAGERLGDDLVCPCEKRRYQINSQGDLEELAAAGEQHARISNT